tara:strand:- start:77 stop:208 length:132 start_codon:yes stop_codon:yes gene_type:complete
VSLSWEGAARADTAVAGERGEEERGLPSKKARNPLAPGPTEFD